MNTKAKLLSLALAAVLLCGCIVGFLMIGANAEETETPAPALSVVTTVDDAATQYATVADALAAAIATDWTQYTSVTITVEDTASNYTTYVNGKEKVDGEEVPTYDVMYFAVLFGDTAKYTGSIENNFVVDADETKKNTIVVRNGSITTTNYYHNLDRENKQIGGMQFTGSVSTNSNKRFNGTLTNNITGGTYDKVTSIGRTTRYDGLNITNTVSGATITVFDGAACTASGSLLTNTIENGSNITTFYGCGEIVEHSISYFYGNMVNTVRGSEIGTFCGSYRGTYTSTAAKVANTVADSTITTYYGIRTGLRSALTNTITNSEITSFYGGTLTASAISGGRNITNTITGGKITTYYGGGAEAATYAGNITNTLTNGVTIEGVYHGGWAKGTHTGNIENNISGTTFDAEGGVYYGASMGTQNGRVTNNFGGGNAVTCSDKSDVYFYGGGSTGTITGTQLEDETEAFAIINNFLALEEGETCSVYGRFWGASSGDGNGNGIVNGSVYNSFKDVRFASWCYGSMRYGTFNGNLYTEIYSGTSLNNAYLGAGYSGTKVYINGNIVTDLYGFSGSIYAGLKSGTWGSYQDGEETAYYGYTLNIYSATLSNLYTSDFNRVNEIVNPVAPKINIILNDEKSGDVTIENMAKPLAVGGDAVFTIRGSETNKLTVGNNFKAIVSEFSGDKLQLVQSTGWLANNYITYIGDGNLADKINVTEADGIYGAYILGDKVLQGKGIALSGAQVILSERITVRFLFDKAEIDAVGTKRFTFAVALAGVDLTESKLGEIGNYYYVSVAGISPADLETAINYSGTFVYSTDITLDYILDTQIAQAGGNQKLIALCNAIKALGTADAVAGAPAAGSVSLDGAYANVTEVISGYGIVMGDAVGYTLYAGEGFDSTKTYTVKVGDDGDVIDATFVTDENGTYLDIFVKVAAADSMMKIQVLDGEISVFEMFASVEQIASLYGENHDGYVAAQEILAYVQAANDYQGTKAAA